MKKIIIFIICFLGLINFLFAQTEYIKVEFNNNEKNILKLAFKKDVMFSYFVVDGKKIRIIYIFEDGTFNIYK